MTRLPLNSATDLSSKHKAKTLHLACDAGLAMPDWQKARTCCMIAGWVPKPPMCAASDTVIAQPSHSLLFIDSAASASCTTSQLSHLRQCCCICCRQHSTAQHLPWPTDAWCSKHATGDTLRHILHAADFDKAHLAV